MDKLQEEKFWNIISKSLFQSGLFLLATVIIFLITSFLANSPWIILDILLIVIIFMSNAFWVYYWRKTRK